MKQRSDRRKEAKIDNIKTQIELLDQELNMGKINHAKIHNLTRIPEDPDSENKRQPMDQENFMELKKYVNKYRDKLIIKSEVQQTKVDRLEGKK